MPASRRPKTPLESLLNEDQSKRLMHFLDARITAVDNSLMEFREKRKIFEQQANDRFEWRSAGRGLDYDYRSSLFSEELRQSIFDLQNDSLNIVGGFAAFITARTVDDFFGTEPFYSVSPEGLADAQLAESIQKHSEWKLRQSPWKDAALDAIDCAISLGEGVIKQTWRREIDEYETRRNVLMYAVEGVEVKGPDDDYVYGPDEFGNGADEIAQGEMLDPITLQPVPALIVAKYPPDPMTGFEGMILPAERVVFEEREIPRVEVRFNNVQASTIHYGDFLCAATEDNLEDAPFVGQRTQMYLSEIIEQFGIDEDTITKFEKDTAEPKTKAAQPDFDRQEQQADDSYQEERPNPLIKLVECWVRHDPVGDRKQRRMYVLYAPDHQVIVEMDYIGNRTPQGKLPFQVVRAFKVKNRWYGRGYFEIYEKAQEFIDRHLNMVAYRNRFHSNPVVFFDASALVEDEETKSFRLEPGGTWRLKPNTAADQCFKVLEFPDFDDRTWTLMQMMIQVIQVRSGITSAAQGEVSSLPSTATATGIETILQSASTLARQPMNLMKGGLEKSLLYALKLIYSNMDRDEIYTYLEGDVQQVGSLEKISVEKLEMNVRLLLTRFKAREAVEAVDKAMPLINQWLRTPEPEKGPVRPVFVQGLKGLGFDQAESIIRQPIQIDPLTGLPVGQQPPMPGEEGAPMSLLPSPDQSQLPAA